MKTQEAEQFARKGLQDTVAHLQNQKQELGRTISAWSSSGFGKNLRMSIQVFQFERRHGSDVLT